MKIQITRTNDDYHMEAKNESEDKVQIDASDALTPYPNGMRPMQLVLSAIGSCSAIDVISILKKQRQQIDSLTIDVEGERDPNQVPSLFQKINLHFHLKGKISPDKLKKALDLSFGTYCSVSKMLEKSVEISYTYTLNGQAEGQ